MSPDGGSRVGPTDDPDRYVVGAPVAAGAEGILFRGSATRAGVEADVAIKMLQPRFLPRVDEWHAKWQDQIHLLRLVRIPGVVAVREGFIGPLPHLPGQAGPERTLYLVMDWVEGEPLDEWVRNRPDRDPFEALNLLLAVATALDLMHSGHFTKGATVVHRDIKPANILVRDQGSVLVDFGMTRALPEGARASGVAGTIGYLAPELTGSLTVDPTVDPTPATDRYALGGVGYFIFTGADPPRSHQPSALRAGLTAVPALADRPDAVEHLMAMLDADPDVRPSPLSNWVGQVRRSTLDEPLGGPVEASDPAGAPGLEALDAWLRGSPAPTTPGAGSHSPQELEEVLAGLAHALISLENSGDLAFVKSQAAGEGRMAQSAGRIAAGFDEIWRRYPLVRDVGDRLASIGPDGGDEAAQLLGPRAITLPDGTRTSAVAHATDLLHQTEEVAAGAAALARPAVEALSHLAASEAIEEELERRAAGIGATKDTELVSAFRSLTGAKEALSRDLCCPTADLDQAIAMATRCVQYLEEAQRTVPERLEQASKQLEVIVEVIGQGKRAFDKATEKILDPVGLCAPLDPTCLDGVGQQLRPWLARIEDHAQKNEWRQADENLHQWGPEASALHSEASSILAANNGPVEQRNQQRGLVGAYRAMQGSQGRAEDTVLCRLHDAASDALYVAPCDLVGARRLVQIYIDAVNGNPPGERP